MRVQSREDLTIGQPRKAKELAGVAARWRNPAAMLVQPRQRNSVRMALRQAARACGVVPFQAWPTSHGLRNEVVEGLTPALVGESGIAYGYVRLKLSRSRARCSETSSRRAAEHKGGKRSYAVPLEAASLAEEK